MNVYMARCFLLASLLALSACGGDGDGDGGDHSTRDASPDAFGFSPAHIDNAVAGGIYTATATVSGFDGTLTASIDNTQGDVRFGLLTKDGEEAEMLPIKSGDTLTLQVTVPATASPGDTAAATVSVGEGGNARHSELRVTVIDSTSPKFSVTFPTPISVTLADAVTLTGYWSDNDDRAITIRLARNGQSMDLPLHGIFSDGRWQIDLPLEEGENVLELEAVDASGNSTKLEPLSVTRTTDEDVLNTAQGLAFANPKSLVLDAVNDRLLAVSVKRVQGVDLRSGYRGTYDLLTMPILRIGGATIFQDELWLSLDILPAIARMPLSKLGAGDVPHNQLSGDFYYQPDLEVSSGLLVDEDAVLVGTRKSVAVSGADEDIVYRIDRKNGSLKTVLSDEHTGSIPKYLQRIDQHRFIHGDKNDIELVDISDPENPVTRNVLPQYSPDHVHDVQSYAYDPQRKRLYAIGHLNDMTALQFGWIDLSNLDGDLESVPVTEIVRTNNDSTTMPGYPAPISKLYGFAIDDPQERLFALSGDHGFETSREVVVINLMPVAVDEDGEPGYDVDSEGNFVRKQTGETVLLSRSGPRDLSE